LFTATGLLACVLDQTIGIRIEEEHEPTGVDLVVPGETAYDLHASTGGARPHLGAGTGTLLSEMND
jgi:ammonium transporter, Amt family